MGAAGEIPIANMKFPISPIQFYKLFSPQFKDFKMKFPSERNSNAIWVHTHR